MRTITAIPLLLLFAFNLFGYQILFYCLQQESDSQLVYTLDHNQYNEADLITLEIPLSLPYYTTTDGFERNDGEVTVNGVVYKYVKRKVADGKLIIKCLPDYNKTRLQQAKNMLCQDSNDQLQHKTDKNTMPVKTGIKRFRFNEYNGNCLMHEGPFYAAANNCYLYLAKTNLLHTELTPPYRPPQVV